MRLREYTAARAVPRYSCAISPGKHCPLFGAGAVLRGIGGITLLYLGTQDCVYYAQKAALEHRLSAPSGAVSSRGPVPGPEQDGHRRGYAGLV